MRKRFQLGPETILIVRRRDVVRVEGEQKARRVFEAVGDDPRALAELMRVAGIEWSRGTSVADAKGALLRALSRGDVVLVRTDEPVPLGRGEIRPAEDDPEVPVAPIHDATFVGVTVVHESGAGYPNAAFELTLPDGERVPVMLSASSSFRYEDIHERGSCFLRPLGHTWEIDEDARGSNPVRTRGDDLFARVGDGAPLSLRTGAEYRIVVEDEILFDYEVRVVDELGEPLADVPLAMTVRDKTHECTTDADGVAKVQAPESDAARVEIPDLPALRELVRPRWTQIREGDWIEEETDHTYMECADPLRVVSAKPQLRQTIVVQPWVVRARLLELMFDTNKTFLLPKALEHVREVVRLYQRRNTATVLIVGHTDATGDAAINDPLSLERARAVRAFLRDDVDAWLGYYDAGMPDSARWGDGEDQLMLQTALAGFDGSPQDPPVVRFQNKQGLEPTGEIDEATRRELVTQYMAADGTTLPAGIEPIVHGCGENFPRPAEETAADAASTDEELAGDRRVELFFFDGDLGVLPEPPGESSKPGSVEYPEWCRRAIETHDFFVRAGTVTVQVLLGALDADGAPPGDRPERLRLTTADGSYDQIRSYNDAVRISLQHFALEFEHVPVAVPCTARIDFHGEDAFAHVLFEDVDVGADTECGEGGLCQEEPPPIAPPPPPEAAAGPGDEDDDDDDDEQDAGEPGIAEHPLL